MRIVPLFSKLGTLFTSFRWPFSSQDLGWNNYTLLDKTYRNRAHQVWVARLCLFLLCSCATISGGKVS